MSLSSLSAKIEEMGFGWKNTYKSGKGIDTITSGLEGAWTNTPIKWDNSYFDILFGYEWELVKSPAGAQQWAPKNSAGVNTVADAHDPNKKHAPMMATTDLALIIDPDYLKISKRFHQNIDVFEDVFAKAWYKLTHRDMGPVSRYLGSEVPLDTLIWQDPISKIDYELISHKDITNLKQIISESDLTVSQLITTAWASASTFRGTDKRGGANGARLALNPQNNWEVNQPNKLSEVIDRLNIIRDDFNQKLLGSKKISLADLIVLAGYVGVENAAKKSGYDIDIDFKPGRNDATQEETDEDSFDVLEPKSDGFRNYIQDGINIPSEQLLLDKSHLLTLTAPEMTVLLAGMRVLNTNVRGSKTGVLTKNPGVLSNDFLINILDIRTEWTQISGSVNLFEGIDRTTGDVKWMASRTDLIFGSNSQLRAISEAYACKDSKEKFIHDFAKVWSKLMNLDRF